MRVPGMHSRGRRFPERSLVARVGAIRSVTTAFSRDGHRQVFEKVDILGLNPNALRRIRLRAVQGITTGRLTRMGLRGKAQMPPYHVIEITNKSGARAHGRRKSDCRRYQCAPSRARRVAYAK